MRKLIIALSIIGAILLVSLIVIIVVIFMKKKDNGPNIGPGPVPEPGPGNGPRPTPTKALVDVYCNPPVSKGTTQILFFYSTSSKYTDEEIRDSFKVGMQLTVISGLNIFSPFKIDWNVAGVLKGSD